ncbi:15-hydroxyprostaglandin dehydrogenase [NAD(+)]-like [Leptidea sinapis]|uniref:15-hydroxyprostaglandin dehydrogenase [NAD(+)]-like n=1 Tax=Leptidea sinapis TaxID=189913 RepID=UPI00212965C8|nr:15-hydroxyprostaglandin dehydrogenase [NAD(+)]-like [Leptidea sinapis]
MFDVKEQVILVTGAASGIGAGLTRAFLDKGAKHVAVLDVNEKLGKELEQELNKKHGENKVKFHKCDVTTEELESAYDRTIEEFGYIDIVVNNAGVMNDSPDVYLKALNINVAALMRSSMKAYNLMRKDRNGKGGTIVNISSIMALFQSYILPVYSAAKSAVLQFGGCLGAQPTYERTGVRVVTVCFGATETNLIHPASMGAIDEVLTHRIAPGLEKMPKQDVESAVKGFMTALENGHSASTWLVTSKRPAEEITDRMKKAYQIMAEGIFQ